MWLQGVVQGFFIFNKTTSGQAKDKLLTGKDITFLGNNSCVIVVTNWGDELAVRLNYGHPLQNKINRSDNFHITWSPEVTQAFART